MSVLVVGVSHKTAPVAVLERLALDGDDLLKLVTDAAASDHVHEATVIGTCNRLEIYAEVDRFHGSVEELSRLLVERADESTEALLPHLYVHYDDGAVSHLFHVAAGLDSMAVGEGQILGQTRDALRLGQELGTLGPTLNSLFQQALRVGKRAHAETDIDRAAPSLVSAALELALASGDSAGGDLAGQRVLVVGAGAMATLAVSTVRDLRAAEVVIVNRTPDRADRLATAYAARPAALKQLRDELSHADVVVTCTGAADVLITAAMLPARPLTLIDLALPHDIDPAVADLPNVTLITLADLADALADTGSALEVDGVRAIVGQELTAFVAARRQANVTPTLVALRSMATDVVDAEVARLDARLPELDPEARAEVLHTIRRVADKLLHQPTVRVKELADEEGVVSYAAALAELFALDPDAVEAVTRPGGVA
jgi:glutamyl-tRNA reductase